MVFDSIVSDTSAFRIVDVNDRSGCDVKGRGNRKEGHVIKGTCQITDSSGRCSELELKRLSGFMYIISAKYPNTIRYLATVINRIAVTYTVP